METGTSTSNSIIYLLCRGKVSPVSLCEPSTNRSCVGRSLQVSGPRVCSHLWPLTFSCGRIPLPFPLTASSRRHVVSVTGLNGKARGSVRLFNERGQLFCGQMRRLPCLYFCSIYHFVLKRVSFTASWPSRQGARWEEGKDATWAKPRQMTWEITTQLQPLPPTMNWNATERNSGPSAIYRWIKCKSVRLAVCHRSASWCWWLDAHLAEESFISAFEVSGTIRVILPGKTWQQVRARLKRLKPWHLVFAWVGFKVSWTWYVCSCSMGAYLK